MRIESLNRSIHQLILSKHEKRTLTRSTLIQPAKPTRGTGWVWMILTRLVRESKTAKRIFAIPSWILLALMVMLFLQTTPLYAQTTLFVDVDALGANNGSDWTNAFTKLQDALAEANARNTDGDGLNDISEIWVAAGTYTPDDKSCSVVGVCVGPDGGLSCTSNQCVWNSPRKQTFQLLNNVALYGGFNGTETLLSQRDVIANETTLSGDFNGNDTAVACTNDSPDCDSFGGLCIDNFCIIQQNNSENSFHVVTGNGTDTTAIIDGFTITAGNANVGTIPNGSGAGMLNETGSPTVTNCTFNGNTAVAAGGMFNTSGSSPTMTNCSFTGNSAVAGSGGGIYNQSSSPALTNCTFSGNQANNVGGGMLNNINSNPALTNCTFSGNSASNGGGIYNESSSPTLTNCTFSGNLTSSGTGGGMVNSSSNPTLTNCTFSGNSAVAGGGGMINSISSPTLTNCTFSGNSAFGPGGGMFNDISNPTVTNCMFIDNTAGLGFSGGGMFNNGGSPTVTNCMFIGNSADVGGAMYNIGTSSPTVVNCMFSSNTARGGGGGMFNSNMNNSTVTNCTFSGNSASLGGGMFNSTNSSPTLSNCILWGNSDSGGMDESAQIHTISGTPAVNYSLIQGLSGALGGVGNIGGDPMFVDPDGADNILGTGDDNLRIKFGSPAIDAGNNVAVPADSADLDNDADTSEPTPLDLAGNSRFVDEPNTPDCPQPGANCGTPPIVDMGAYEFIPTINFALIPVSADGAHTINGNKIILHESGQRIFLEVRYANWSPELLKGFEVRIDSSGYTSGTGDPLELPIEACADDAICESTLGSGSKCALPGDPPNITGVNTCRAGFFTQGRPDDIPAGNGGPFGLADVGTNSLNFSYGHLAITDPPKSDPGFDVYGGTLVLEDPGNAVGTYTINFKPPPDSVAVYPINNDKLANFQLIFEPARLFFPDCNGNGIPDDQDIAGGSSVDCNGNLIPDECDLANCTGEPFCSDCNLNGTLDVCDINNCAGTPDCDDCNLNGVPDSCDIASGTSLDTNPMDGVPDECASPNTISGNWTDTTIWNLNNQYPDGETGNPDGTEGIHVTIKTGQDILLDDTVQIPSLRVSENGILRMTQADPGADLLIVPGSIVGDGNVVYGTELVANDNTIDLCSSGTCLDMKILGRGVFMRDSSSVDGTSCVGANPQVCTTLETGNLTISDDNPTEGLDPCTESGGMMILEGAMSAIINGDFVIGSETTCGGLASGSAGSVAGERLPPIKGVSDTATFSVVGSYVMLSNVQLNNLSSNNMIVGCNFENQSIQPGGFDMSTGGITLCLGDPACTCTGDITNCPTCNDDAGFQTFEVAGRDLGITFDGFGGVEDTNFSMDRLQIGTDVTSSHVIFVNKHENTIGTGACQEALYVRELDIKPSSTVTLDNVVIYYDNDSKISENDITVERIGCGDLIRLCSIKTPLADPNSPGTLACNDGDNYGLACMTCSGGSRNGEKCLDSDDCIGGGVCEPNNSLCPKGTCGGAIVGGGFSNIAWPKSRYIGVQPNLTSAGIETAIRVTLVDIDGFPSCNGEIRWAGPPVEYCEGSACAVTFFGSKLQNTPHFMDWTTVGVVQLFGEEIIPGSRYAIQMITRECEASINDESVYSTPALLIETAKWGDVIRPLFPFTSSTQPSIADILSIVDKWLGSLEPVKTQSQLQPQLLNPHINVGILDILKGVDAWLGSPYPYSGPANCPP